MSSVWHYYDVYHHSCDVGLRRSCVHGVIKCFVESSFILLFFSLLCVYLHKVFNKTSAKFIKDIFINLLEMSKVYDLVGQPSYIVKTV